MNRTEQLSSFAARLRDEIRRASDPAPSPVFPFAPLALELFALQFEHNPAYRRLCTARPAHPGRTNLWSDIPAVPTAAFKELELTCLPPGERTTVFHSSGTTTRQPSRHFHCPESLHTYECSMVPWLQRHLLPEWGARTDFHHFLALTPAPARAPNSSLVHMFATAQREFGQREQTFNGIIGADDGWNVDVAMAIETIRRAIGAPHPLVLLGTAFSYVHLLDALAESGTELKLPGGSRAMETGGYKGRSREMPKAGLHQLITRHLGIPASHIVCEYGMSELSSQAYDQVCGALQPASSPPKLFTFPPWCRAVVISPETGGEVAEGKTGLLRLFDLANVWSVLAVQTEDLAIRRGHHFELLGRAQLAEPRGCSLMTT